MIKLLFILIVFVLLVPSVYAESSVVLKENNDRTVAIGKQIQIASDLKNNQDIQQDFAYIVQIQNEQGVTVSLSWLTGTLEPAQSFSPAISWIPNEQGRYEATIFVWESVNNPSALSPTLSLAINVESNA